MAKTWQSFLLVTIVCTGPCLKRMLINEPVATIVILFLAVKFYIVHNCSLHMLGPAALSRGSERTMHIRVTPYRKGRQQEFYCSCGGTGCVCNTLHPVLVLYAVLFTEYFNYMTYKAEISNTFESSKKLCRAETWYIYRYFRQIILRNKLRFCLMFYL